MTQDKSPQSFFATLFHAVDDDSIPLGWSGPGAEARPICEYEYNELPRYYHVGVPVKGWSGTLEHLRPSKDDMECLAFLWCDFDTDKAGLPIDELLSMLAFRGLLPQAVVNTGGGHHLYWVLEELIPTGPGERLCYQLQSALRALCGPGPGGKLDSTHDCTRVLRCPATMNEKHSKGVVVEMLRSGEFLDMDSLEEFLEEQGCLAEEPGGRGKADATSGRFEAPTEEMLEHLREWDDRTDDLIAGSLPKRPRNGERELWANPSAIDFRLVCSALKSGAYAYVLEKPGGQMWTDSQLAWLMAAHHAADPNVKEGKIQRNDYVFEMTIPKARDVTSVPGTDSDTWSEDGGPVNPDTVVEFVKPSSVDGEWSVRQEQKAEYSALVRKKARAVFDEEASERPQEAVKVEDELGDLSKAETLRKGTRGVLKMIRAGLRSAAGVEPEIVAVWRFPDVARLSSALYLIKLKGGERIPVSGPELRSRTKFADKWMSKTGEMLPQWSSKRNDEWAAVAQAFSRVCVPMPKEHCPPTDADCVGSVLNGDAKRDPGGLQVAMGQPGLVTTTKGRELSCYPSTYVRKKCHEVGIDRDSMSTAMHAAGFRTVRVLVEVDGSLRSVTCWTSDSTVARSVTVRTTGGGSPE